MKYAIFNNQKIEATKGSIGYCPCCKAELIAKCGDVKIHHWAHKGKLMCDPWWENETEWHRSWKNNFPIEWQEIVHFAQDGEKHIADIKTDEGWVIEFQHSHLKPEERNSRTTFYKKIIWIIDGTRRVNDSTQFRKSLKPHRTVSNKLTIYRIDPSTKCRLFNEWYDERSWIFFDFGNRDHMNNHFVWFIAPKNTRGVIETTLFPKSLFLELNKNCQFYSLVDIFIEKTQ